MKKFKVGLALSGGGICGVAHISFLKLLVQNGIKIDMIAGSSMGAIVGGLYAGGMDVDEIERVVRNLSKNDIFELNGFKILKQGIFAGNKIEKLIDEHLSIKNIEEGIVEYFATAVDMLTGDLFIFDKGPFVDAMRASSAIPGIFAPVYLNNTCYVDGGLLDNIPYKILKEKGADVIIVVDCLGDYSLPEIPKNTISLLADSFMLAVDYITKLHKENGKGVYDIYCSNATPGVNGLSSDFKDIDRILASGKVSAEKYIFEIKDIIEKKKKLFKNT